MHAKTTDRARVGTVVDVTGLIPGATTTIQLVPGRQADYFHHMLPPDSILGAALVGARVGDTVGVEALDNEVRMEVLRIQDSVQVSSKESGSKFKS